MSKGSHPLQIWKGPKTYTRWDRKVGWIWKCHICPTEAEPCGTLMIAYSDAVKHLQNDHLNSEFDLG